MPRESRRGRCAPLPHPAAKGEPLDLKLDGLKPMGDTEFYNADNLFEKIDGRAPAYLNFNVQSSAAAPSPSTGRRAASWTFMNTASTRR